MKIFFMMFFIFVSKTIAANYSSESSGKETYNFSIDTMEAILHKLRKQREPGRIV